jgi:alcohol dehydrogenase
MRILGHEAVGTVEVVGSGVKTVKAGDRVLVSCVSVCGTCRYCREGHAGQCLGGGGWILGYKIDGTQAEYVRVPFADASTYPLPDGASDEDILMLADILPTCACRKPRPRYATRRYSLIRPPTRACFWTR